MLIGRGRKHGPIGLDLGSTGVRMIQFADAMGDPVVQAATHFELPPGITDARERAEMLERAVKDAMATRPFCGREVVAGLGLSEFQMKSIRLPKMPPEELAAAVEFEAQDRFDMAGKPAQVRFFSAGEVRHGTEIKEEILVFAATQEAVTSKVEMLQALGLRPTAVDVTPCAVARSFIRFLRRSEDAASVNVFLDVGGRGSSIVITRGTDICFVKLLDVGGEQMNAAVAKALNLSPDQAAELRVRILHESASSPSKSDNAIPDEIRARAADAIRPIAERICRDMQLCLRYLAVTFRGQRPGTLTLVGGEAHEPELHRAFSASVDIPCTIGHPLRGMAGIEQALSRDERTLAPAWSVATGLALRGATCIRTSTQACGSVGAPVA
ncbi:MAG: pilus assembly protein PilM [Planctomycetia bacterium]|nr:pilus assembly protein PilM [Planctomycetia bacterium]MCC7316161.1 pilus assembly protein PilM [Planctomycetota bacterium]